MFLGIPQPIPDLASDAFGEFYTRLLQPLKAMGVDGVMSDDVEFSVVSVKGHMADKCRVMDKRAPPEE